MEITIKVEVAPSPELLALIRALTGPIQPVLEKGPEHIALRPSSEPQPSRKKAVTETKTDSVDSPSDRIVGKTVDWSLEDLKRMATILQTETDFNVKDWLSKHNAISMSRLNKDEYNDLYAELMQIAGEHDVQPF